jgi:3-isopropylmalate/(R)-2-methylmalate dehydratase large subunit
VRYTFAEKALARNAGLAPARAGQVIDASPDLVLSHDNTAAIARIFREIGLDRVRHPDRLAITLDHAVPAPTTQHAQNHADIRRFVAEQGVRHFFEVGRGICHQVLCEEGLVRPGMLVVGADSHSTHYGALGAFGAGLGRSEVAAIWATGRIWLRVPESLKITLAGRLGEWVSAKDLALHVIGALGADAGAYASVEFHGPAVAAMSMESRFVLPNMMAEMGVKNAWIAPDQTALAWLAERSPVPLDLSRAAELLPDPDAAYAAEHTFDASAVEPQVACPHRVDNVVPLSQVAGRPVQQAFLGTCTNGRLEDLAQAARVLRGRRVAPGTRLLVIPASSQVLQDALRLGYLETLLSAGAALGTPGCGPCMGNHLGVPAPGEATISTANRNFRGRMGTRDAEIYLASPAVVAASAAAGAIAHPRDVMRDT